MKKSILLFLLVISFLSSGAATVKGIIHDDTGKAVEFANAVLINASDSSIVKASLTVASGGFEFDQVPMGKYLLYGYQLGFNKTYSPLLNITNEQDEIILPPINLIKHSQELGEVSV